VIVTLSARQVQMLHAGLTAAELVIEVNGHRLRSSDADFEAITMAVAGGEVTAEALAIWIRQRLEPREV
jgi:prophage maintenance system killer protein